MTIESEDDAGKKAYVIEENNPPKFKEEPTLIHTVNVLINENGKMNEESDYIYKSANITDPEGHKVEIETSGLDEHKFISITIADSQMVMTIERKKIND